MKDREDLAIHIFLTRMKLQATKLSLQSKRLRRNTPFKNLLCLSDAPIPIELSRGDKITPASRTSKLFPIFDFKKQQHGVPKSPVRREAQANEE
jgi:hypothetical protein